MFNFYTFEKKLKLKKEIDRLKEDYINDTAEHKRTLYRQTLLKFI
jgi:hypothetical protein